jgi:hypothetical protein
MLTIWGAKQRRFCDGLTRRNFLKIGALGAGLSLADVLRLRAGTGSTSPTSTKSAILIHLNGGPSHIDMYDLKPEAPVEFRGEFKPIRTNVPGVDLCELMPLQAQMWDKLACIRSVVAANEHSDSATTTGYTEAVNNTVNHPSLGAVVSKLRADHSDVPPFVSFRGRSRGSEPGFLGASHGPFAPSSQLMGSLRLPSSVSLERMEDRKNLLTRFDSVRRDLDARGTLKAMDGFTARAFDVVASGKVRMALDLSKEERGTRDRYRGVEQFLLARRLVEAGVGCVTLGINGWDTHEANFKTLRRLLPEVDRGIANLVRDLCDRGMDKDVVTVMWGEFGRNPKIGNVTPDGRGHWPPVMSALIAGGGLKMGQVVGSSSARAEVPKDRPYRVSQVLSTVYRAIGIDPAMTFNNGSGRPMYVLDDRDPVSELI